MTGVGAAPVQELRQYVLRPGERDTLVNLFRSDLVAEQKACGMAIGGIYGDEERPDRFVWWRGFTDHDQRVDALESFYLGPPWAKHRDIANATMRDSDDVALLAPVGSHQPGPDNHVALTLVSAATAERLPHIAAELTRMVSGLAGVSVLAWVTDPTPNRFPQLPVRNDLLAVVGVGADSPRALDIATQGLAARSTAGNTLQTSRLRRLL